MNLCINVWCVLFLLCIYVCVCVRVCVCMYACMYVEWSSFGYVADASRSTHTQFGRTGTGTRASTRAHTNARTCTSGNYAGSGSISASKGDIFGSNITSNMGHMLGTKGNESGHIGGMAGSVGNVAGSVGSMTVKMGNITGNMGHLCNIGGIVPSSTPLLQETPLLQGNAGNVGNVGGLLPSSAYAHAHSSGFNIAGHIGGNVGADAGVMTSNAINTGRMSGLPSVDRGNSGLSSVDRGISGLSSIDRGVSGLSEAPTLQSRTVSGFEWPFGR